MRLPVAFVSVLLLTPAFLAQPKPSKKAELAKPVKDFKLKDVVNGKSFGLSSQKGKIVVLIWYSPNCGACPSYNDRLKKFTAAYQKKKVVLYGINSDSLDTPKEIRAYAKGQKFNFPLLRDGTAAVAGYFNVGQTCTCIVIDGQGIMRYWGAFDDSNVAAEVKQRYVKDAVDAILSGKKVPQPKTMPFG